MSRPAPPSALVAPERFFATRFGLSPDRLEQALSSTLRSQVDYADLYVEHTVRDAVSLEEGIVKKASRAVEQGAGIRALSGEKTGYAHTDDLSTPALRGAAEAARAIAAGRGGETTSVAVTPARQRTTSTRRPRMTGPSPTRSASSSGSTGSRGRSTRA
jgi:TldD protein